MSLSKEELIKKLQTILDLRDKAISIQSKIDDFEPDDNYERKVTLPEFPGEFHDEEVRKILRDKVDHNADYAVELVSNGYDKVYCPKKPAEPKIDEFNFIKDSATKSKLEKLGCFSYVAAGASGFFLLSLIIGSAEGAVVPIIIIALIAAVLFLFLRYKIKLEKNNFEKKKEAALAEYTRHKNELLDEYNKKLEKYKSEYAAHEIARQNFLDEYIKWQVIYLEHVKEENEIEEKLEQDRLAEVNRIEAEELTPALQDLADANDILSNDYLAAADVIIDLLKSGRADDLKEAINLYENILYRERQLQLEREKEEQRQYEEQLRREDEERRHREDMEFREQQEYNRQREEERREQEAERRHREDMRAREAEARHREYQEQERARREQLKEAQLQREQESRLWDAAKKQCQACANAGHCNMMVYNKTPNCTGFRPR